MDNNGYVGVIKRFLRDDERLVLSDAYEMPLVLEADKEKDLRFLQIFLTTHSEKIIADMARYGVVLLRGFNVHSEEDFENTVLSIKGLNGITEAFMSEQGRIHVGNLKFVLHTNAVYKTGGTLYLGGFHAENYYSADVPGFICFCCLKPSEHGGETGLVNMEKVYQSLEEGLKNKLEKQAFFVSNWLVSEVAERYQLPVEKIEIVCQHFGLPVIGDGDTKTILMYKPSVYIHPITQQKALQINLFELPTLNAALRRLFLKDYPGKMWFWHRFVWRLPESVLHVLEFFYLFFASLFYSPKESFKILRVKIKRRRLKRRPLPSLNMEKVGQCFNKEDVEHLAQSIRNAYSSCIWKQGDILLIDNKKVAHAGMPGFGERTIRAMICNPLDMQYSASASGCLLCNERSTESIGCYMVSGDV